MRVAVDGLPDTLHLQSPLFDLLAHQSVEDSHRSLQRIHPFADGLMVPASFVGLLLEELLYLLSGSPLFADQVRVDLVVLAPRILLLLHQRLYVLHMALTSHPLVTKLLLHALLVGLHRLPVVGHVVGDGLLERLPGPLFALQVLADGFALARARAALRVDLGSQVLQLPFEPAVRAGAVLLLGLTQVSLQEIQPLLQRVVFGTILALLLLFHSQPAVQRFHLASGGGQLRAVSVGRVAQRLLQVADSLGQGGVVFFQGGLAASHGVLGLLQRVDVLSLHLTLGNASMHVVQLCSGICQLLGVLGSRVAQQLLDVLESLGQRRVGCLLALGIGDKLRVRRSKLGQGLAVLVRIVSDGRFKELHPLPQRCVDGILLCFLALQTVMSLVQRVQGGGVSLARGALVGNPTVRSVHLGPSRSELLLQGVHALVERGVMLLELLFQLGLVAGHRGMRLL
mmetsp:Transcript_52572/g.123472  ORF Transcript_52572/g.123472 Transcript_52572/m.123472 type:complete len:454 (+) Transcript_52572:608-1969(+)